MSSSNDHSTFWRRFKTILASWVALAALVAAALVGSPTAMADSAVSPKSGAFTIKGAGFGHGWGMSQYGAYGAATKGQSWKQILAFYYRGTSRTTMPAGSTIRVRIGADNDGEVRVVPIRGLRVHDSHGHSFTVPTGSKYRSWRIRSSKAASGYQLSYATSSGKFVSVSAGLSTGAWKFSSSEKLIKLILPGGAVGSYRGSMLLVKSGNTAYTVNRVKFEDYVKGVVPSEMPTSWAADAVRAQAVAARSYALRLKERGNYVGYHVCDNTNCQVYGGMSRENTGGNAAVDATAGVVLTYQGAVALTQFASSNGGHTAHGDYAYLWAHADPYDSVIISQKWSKKITAESVRRAWPSVGTVKSIKIISRDGQGAWGGRVRSIKIIGSKRTETVSGKTFQYRFGLRSNLLTVTA